MIFLFLTLLLCLGISVDDNLVLVRYNELLHDLDALASPEDCSEARVLVYKWWNNGFGAEVHALSLALTLALMSNRTLVTTDSWVYAADEGACGQQHNERCYFEPLSRCTLSDVGLDTAAVDRLPLFAAGLAVRPDARQRPPRTVDGYEGWLDYGVDPGNADHRVVLFTQHVQPDPWDLRLAVPRPYQPLGLFWWRSVLVSRVLRPNAALLDRLTAPNALATRFTPPLPDDQWPVECVAMHIRRGDKVRETKLFQLAEYDAVLPRVEPAERRERVFVATDDPGLAASMAMYQCPGRDDYLKAHYYVQKRNPYGATADDGFHQRFLNSAAYNASELVETIMFDLFYLSKCQTFVGTLSSNFGRLLFELMSVSDHRVGALGSLTDLSPYTLASAGPAAGASVRATARDVTPFLKFQSAAQHCDEGQHCNNGNGEHLSFASLDREWHVFP